MFYTHTSYITSHSSIDSYHSKNVRLLQFSFMSSTEDILHVFHTIRIYVSLCTLSGETRIYYREGGGGKKKVGKGEAQFGADIVPTITNKNISGRGLQPPNHPPP